MSEVFTVGEVSKILKVSPRLVMRWFDTGRLGGYRIPGTGDRRIRRGDLVSFVKTHGMDWSDFSEGRE